MTKPTDPKLSSQFKVFLGAEARPCDLMSVPEEIPVAEDSCAIDGSAPDPGHDLTVLFDKPGLSLVRAWFKSEYPLPRHTHDVDCLYYIVGGSLRMGEQVLNAGDGFYVGAGVPYSYTPGPQGVEILEFRAANRFDIRIMGDAAKIREKSMAKIVRRQDAWTGETQPPSR